MTDDAITEARRLLDTWYGLTTTHEEFLARAQTDLAAILSATGAAEARVTALEQDAAKWRAWAQQTFANSPEQESFTDEQLQSLIRAWRDHQSDEVYRLTVANEAAEAQLTTAEEQYVLQVEHCATICAERDNLQAQLTAVRALVQKWRDPAECDLIVDYAGAADELDAALPPTPEET